MFTHKIQNPKFFVSQSFLFIFSFDFELTSDAHALCCIFLRSAMPSDWCATEDISRDGRGVNIKKKLQESGYTWHYFLKVNYDKDNIIITIKFIYTCFFLGGGRTLKAPPPLLRLFCFATQTTQGWQRDKTIMFVGPLTGRRREHRIKWKGGGGRKRLRRWGVVQGLGKGYDPEWRGNQASTFLCVSVSVCVFAWVCVSSLTPMTWFGSDNPFPLPFSGLLSPLLPLIGTSFPYLPLLYSLFSILKVISFPISLASLLCF